jgi:hypothetical protein
VHSAGGTAYTEVLEALTKKTDQLAEDVEVVRIQTELLRLDQDWENEKDHYMIRGQHGNMHVPTRGTAVGSALAGLFFGVVLALQFGGGFIVVGILVALVGAYVAKEATRKYDIYHSARANYQRQRIELLLELERLQG